ncbi:MAG: hypothetical protein AB7O52_18860 [Planctomycetota bacterium]
MARRGRRLFHYALLCGLLAVGSPAAAQFSRTEGPAATLKIGRGPYYANLPVDLYVEAEGFDAAADPPTCEPPEIVGATLTFVDVTPSRRSFFRSVNGRVTQGEEVSYSFHYQLLTSEAGPCDIGSFTVTQGGVSRVARGGRIKVDRIAEDPGAVAVKLLVPEQPVFVGQAVDVTLEWTLGASVRSDVSDYHFVVPLFGAVDRFRFIDPEVTDRRTALRIGTTAGDVTLPYTTEEAADGSGAVVLRAKRTAVPLRDGTIELPPTTVIIDRVTRYERDLFGRRPAEVRKYAARDLPRRLIVQPVPAANRPATFAGAIGSGFRLEVSADRTVVQVGDPLKLTLVLTGAGLLETAGAPRLDAPGNLAPTQFRVPSDRELGGQIEGGVKTFVTSVRVLDEGLREIPPIEYAWFDPEKARFETTRSAPIALRVSRGTLVTAEDVIASSANPPPTSPPNGAIDEVPSAATTGRPNFTLTGAELSLEPDPKRLLRRRDGVPGGAAVLAGLYGAPLLLVALAWVGRRRAAVDPRLLQRHKHVAEQVRKIEGAAALPAREAAAQVAQALRAVIAEMPTVRGPETEDLLASCDAVVYAPTSELPEKLAPAVRDRSLAIARQALTEARA